MVSSGFYSAAPAQKPMLHRVGRVGATAGRPKLCAAVRGHFPRWKRMRRRVPRTASRKKCRKIKMRKSEKSDRRKTASGPLGQAAVAEVRAMEGVSRGIDARHIRFSEGLVHHPPHDRVAPRPRDHGRRGRKRVPRKISKKMATGPICCRDGSPLRKRSPEKRVPFEAERDPNSERVPNQ
jgi:hypothetical protein